jgi:hypothetical protein
MDEVFGTPASLKKAKAEKSFRNKTTKPNTAQKFEIYKATHQLQLLTKILRYLNIMHIFL